MHAGTFLGRAWGRGRVFVSGFPGIRGFQGFQGFRDFGSFRASCCVSMCRAIMCHLLVRACKTLQINKWSGLCTSPGQKQSG
jgi:hypothetical protein